MGRPIHLTCFLLVLTFGKGHSQDPANFFVGLRELTIGGRLSSIPAELYKEGTAENDWTLVSQTLSTDSGIDFPITEEVFMEGNYRVVVYMEEYYASQNISTFYPYVEFVFEKTTNANEEYTIPLLVSPFGYTGYRGSN